MPKRLYRERTFLELREKFFIAQRPPPSPVACAATCTPAPPCHRPGEPRCRTSREGCGSWRPTKKSPVARSRPPSLRRVEEKESPRGFRFPRALDESTAAARFWQKSASRKRRRQTGRTATKPRGRGTSGVREWPVSEAAGSLVTTFPGCFGRSRFNQPVACAGIQ